MDVKLICQEDLEPIIKSIEDLKKLVQDSRKDNEDRLLDSHELCSYLKITSRTLQNYRDRKLLKFSKIGSDGKILYRMSDINHFLDKHSK